MDNLKIIKSKIIEGESLKRQLSVWSFLGKRIVFTNGCFDIIHLGHIDYLSKAKDLGDILIVGLNTDDSVKRIKGDTRPITDEKSRAMILSSLRFVDAVVFFNEDTPHNLIKEVQPDILIKGSDYKADEIVGSDIVQKKGGKVITIDYLEGYSTTSILEKVKN
ncbi:MAG: D-glycero-beta-D-manno-heptose 1-phosphate adenylyltransferase [Bacteroidales bacterium]|nr:D-glycero-beta-D-manno-heptose 1-phosphate adenylyltransferase [Bacteroidales bacterium]